MNLRCRVGIHRWFYYPEGPPERGWAARVCTRCLTRRMFSAVSERWSIKFDALTTEQAETLDAMWRGSAMFSSVANSARVAGKLKAGSAFK